MDNLNKALVQLKILAEILYQDDIKDAKQLKIDHFHHWHLKPIVENVEKIIRYLKVLK